MFVDILFRQLKKVFYSSLFLCNVASFFAYVGFGKYFGVTMAQQFF